MRKVCLIETESHYEVVRNFVLSIAEKAAFTIVTNTFCINNLSAISRANVEIVNYETERELASEIMSKDGFDYKLTMTPPSCQFYREHTNWFHGSDLLIHNMNYWFQPFQNIYFFKHPSLYNLKSLARFLKYLPSLLRRRKEYLKVFRSFIAPSEELYQHYKQFSKLRTYIRLDYNAETLRKIDKAHFQIVIPGTVNSFRDYVGVLEVIRKLAQEGKQLIKVYLLGLNQIRLDVEVYQDEMLEIITFDEVLSEEDYLGVLRSSDLGLLPLKEEVDHMGILERKGSSNISGGVNDLVYVGLRGMVPEFYNLGNNDQFVTYSSFSEMKESLSDANNLKDGKGIRINNIEVIQQNYLVTNS